MLARGQTRTTLGKNALCQRAPKACDGHEQPMGTAFIKHRPAGLPVTMSEPFLLASGYVKKMNKETISVFFLCDLCVSVVCLKGSLCAAVVWVCAGLCVLRLLCELGIRKRCGNLCVCLSVTSVPLWLNKKNILGASVVMPPGHAFCHTLCDLCLLCGL